MSEAATPTLAPPLEDPYVGLTHFTEEYDDRFFGREAESSLIIGNLRASRLTLLYAESGVGKSSVLRAGVVAPLRKFADRDLQSRGSVRLVPIVFSSWSERPVEALIHAIGESIRPYLSGTEAPELPKDDLVAALELAGQAVDATLLVILDQFEEYFLYPDEEPEQSRIAAQITRCVKRPDLRANFVISIREDSYARLGDLFRGKIKNVYSNFLQLDFLSRAGAREAIERPIERINELRPDSEPYGIDPALVDAVLDQVGRDEEAGEADKIETAYLQLVMRRLWEEETRMGSHILRLQTLRELGGAEAIIGNHLDRAMEGDGDGGAGLDRDQRRTAAAIFRFLVTSGGTKIALTPNDLAEVTGISKERIDPVLQHLSSPRLHILRPVLFEDGESESRFEIFHDALAAPIVKWRTKIEEEERNARLNRERAEKEEAQRAAVVAERRALQERKRKRVALALLALAIAAILGGIVIFAIDQKNLADQREADNQSVRAAERISELSRAPNFGPTAAALASVEAYRLSPTSEARDRALAQLQLNPGLPAIAAGHTRAVETVAFWPGSGNFASGGDDETVRLWSSRADEMRSPKRGSPLIAHGIVREVAVSKPAGDGTRIVAAGLETGTVDLWRITDSGEYQLRSRIPAGPGPLLGVAFDPRRRDLLAVGDSSGRVTLWHLDHSLRAARQAARSVPGAVQGLVFADDGRSLFVAGSEAGEMFRLSGGRFASGPIRKAAGAYAVAAAPNGSYAFAGRSGIALWDGEGGPKLRLRPPGQVEGLAFADGGSVLVSAGSDWNVTTWDVGSGRPFGPPRFADKARIRDLAISPDGRTIAAAGADRWLKLWPLQPPHVLADTVGGFSPVESGGGGQLITDLAVGAGGRLVTASQAGTSIWSLRHLDDPGFVPHPLGRIGGPSYAVAYHGQTLVVGKGNSFVLEGMGKACRGRRPGPCPLAVPSHSHSEWPVAALALARYGPHQLLASAGRKRGKGIVNLWELSGAAEGGKITWLSSRRVDGEIYSLAFNAQSALVAAAARDGKLRVWDVSEPADPHGVKIKHARGNENQPVYALAFSRDGSLLASGGADQQVVLWKVAHHESGRITVDATPGTLLEGQSILSLAFSPDGKTLAVGNGEGSTCLYEVASRHLIGDRSCLRGHSIGSHGVGRIEAVQFVHRAGAGPVLLTAGTGQAVVAWKPLLWSLSGTDQVEEAIADDVCALAGRNLTGYEWSSVFASTDLAGSPDETCP